MLLWCQAGGDSHCPTFSIIFYFSPSLSRLLFSERVIINTNQVRNQLRSGSKLFKEKKNYFSHKLSVNPFVPIIVNYYNFQTSFDGAISCHYRHCQPGSHHLDLSTLHYFSVFSIHHILSPDLTIIINSLLYFYDILVKKKLL